MKKMQAIIDPLDRLLLEKELTKDKFIRKTNNGNNDIYVITYEDSPNLMREIGRLRELTFRSAGGGTGKDVDIDEYDKKTPQYKQLLVWNPKDKEIVGSYRFIRCKDAVKPDGRIHLATSELFYFSEKFINKYLPYTIELGRSFVQPFYQPVMHSRKGMFSLANLWDGLGAVIIDNTDIKYFFGKVTMYPHFNSFARDMIYYFLLKYFPDNDNLLRPIKALQYSTDIKLLESIFNKNNHDEDYKILLKNVHHLNENIPPLVNAYMKLSPDMRIFGTAINKEFGDVYETGMLMNIEKIYDYKIERHISNYNKIQ
jgi:hypothetical protein